MNRYYIVIIVIIAFGCTSSTESRSASEDQVEQKSDKPIDKATFMVGTWKNLNLQVAMKSYKSSEDDSLLLVGENQWEEILQIKPILTVYNSDGSYTSDYRNPSDSLVLQGKGEWSIAGDSLIMIEYGISNNYFLKIEGDKAEFTANLDWDEDGLKDDAYHCVQQKVD